MSTADLLPCVEIEPAAPARHAVIWLHGLGADGHDFEPIVPELGVDPALAVRFVFPHAPRIPVTLNMGMVMPAWYDIRDLGAARGDLEGLARSAGHVRRLIDREHERGIPAERIVLAGFSQGGAVALYQGLRHPERLAGLLALSTYLMAADALTAERSPANEGLPIFQAHGEYDPMVQFAWGEACRDRLVALGHPVAWHAYPMQHAVHPQEILDIGAWLNARLGGDGDGA